jgi:hypothetical protein
MARRWPEERITPFSVYHQSRLAVDSEHWKAQYREGQSYSREERAMHNTKRNNENIESDVIETQPLSPPTYLVLRLKSEVQNALCSDS